MPTKHYIVLATNPDYHDEPICDGAFSTWDKAVAHRRQRISAQVDEEVAKRNIDPNTWRPNYVFYESGTINLDDGYSWIIKEITFYE